MKIAEGVQFFFVAAGISGRRLVSLNSWHPENLGINRQFFTTLKKNVDMKQRNAPINMEAPNRRKDWRPRTVFAEQGNLLFLLGAGRDGHLLLHERVELVVVECGHGLFKLIVTEAQDAHKDSNNCG